MMMMMMMMMIVIMICFAIVTVQTGYRNSVVFYISAIYIYICIAATISFYYKQSYRWMDGWIDK